MSLSHLALLYVDGWVWVGSSEAKQLNSFPPAVSSLLVAVSKFELRRLGRDSEVDSRGSTGLVVAVILGWAFVVQV